MLWKVRTNILTQTLTHARLTAEIPHTDLHADVEFLRLLQTSQLISLVIVSRPLFPTATTFNSQLDYSDV